MAGALGLVLTGDTVPVEGRHAIPVYVDDTLPIVGPSRACVVTTGEIPQAGGPPLAVRLAPAGTPAIGPALPVYVVSGSLSSAPAVSPPVNSVLPVVSGTTELGATLTTTDGTWSGAPTYTYQWKRGGVAIGGATNNTYVLVSADLGTTITSTVTATNAGGSTAATSAGTAIPNWLLLDRFTTNQAAPLTTPRTCQPGPGTLTIVDTGNNLSIVGSALVMAGGASAWGNPGVRTPATVARADGRALLCQFTKTSTATFAPAIGWSISTNMDHDSGDFNQGGVTLWSTGQFTVRIGGVVTPVGAYSAATLYTIGVILHTTGWIVCVSGGAYAAFPQMTVLHISTVIGTNAFYPALSDYNAAGTYDNLRVVDLGGNFANDAYYATLSVNDVITVPNV